MDSVPDTDVEQMTHDELVDEYSKLGETLFYDGPNDDIRDALYDRRLELWQEMESRVSVEYPPCPNCGGTNWSQTPGDPKVCSSCGHEPVNGDVIESIDDAWQKVLNGR